jgi:two-component system sensor histidine kinase YesM
MDVKIPRLIIQPIVENVVEHGGDASGSRVGRLMVEGDEKNLLIRVENNGVMTEEDREKIRILLSDEKPVENQQLDRMRIGIRNVNLRLKLLYGEESGLSIEEREGTTVSTIRIRKLPERNKENQAQTSTDKNDRQNGQ